MPHTNSSPADESSHVGRFIWDTVADSWWWSEGLYRLYGYQPHVVEPSLERFVQHKHPADMARIDAVFDRCLSGGGPFSCYHHIVDANDRQKTVVVVGHGERDQQNLRTVSMQGFMVDVTETGRQETNEALQAALQTRSGIEQVKGALMLVHGLDADAAFDVLRSHSQIYNIKLATLVHHLLEAFRRRGNSDGISPGQLDQMLWDAAHR
jgi:hypothetical protein